MTPLAQNQSILATHENDFETDLMEILSPVRVSPTPVSSEVFEFPTPDLPQSSSPLPLSPLSSSPETLSIAFTSQPAEAPFVVALTARIPRRDTPFKHKATNKRPLSSQIQKIATVTLLPLLTHPFLTPQTNPLHPNSSHLALSNSQPLLPADHVGSLLPQEENPSNNI